MLKWISEVLGGVESEVVVDLVPTAHGTEVSVVHGGTPDSGVRADIGRFWLTARHALDTIIFSAQPPNA